jgi:hypothetical protein
VLAQHVDLIGERQRQLARRGVARVAVVPLARVRSDPDRGTLGAVPSSGDPADVLARTQGAWVELDRIGYDTVWDPFDARFEFRPGMDAERWPGITEPAASITYAIGFVYDRDAVAYERRTLDLCTKTHAAFRACVAPDEAIVVLDWQHPAFRWWPHRPFSYQSDQDWPVPVLPNGDYYVFLLADLSCGVFGHPWEQTVCVFGERLLAAFASDPREIFCRPVRVGGKPIGG